MIDTPQDHLREFIRRNGLSEIDAMNRLQNAGIVSDNAVTVDDVADVQAAIKYMETIAELTRELELAKWDCKSRFKAAEDAQTAAIRSLDRVGELSTRLTELVTGKCVHEWQGCECTKCGLDVS